MVKCLGIFVGSYYGVIYMNSEIRRSGLVIKICNCNSHTRQEDYKFKSSLDYITRLWLNNFFLKNKITD